MDFWRVRRKSEEGSTDAGTWGIISPGRRSAVPYTICAGVVSAPSRHAARIPSSTTGRSSIQDGDVRRAFRAPFSCLWNRSTNPLAWGW